MPSSIDLDRPLTWPDELLELLDCHHHIFKQVAIGTRSIASKDYHQAICALHEALQPFTIPGWHCTRLTEDEAAAISAGGLKLPNSAMLNHRIDALVASQTLTTDVAISLKARNQAGEKNRAGMLWFCFYPPRLAGEKGIQRFFRHWGGEALYNSHENNPITAPWLRVTGTPCIVEADVPISSLAKHDTLSEKIVRRFLISHGLKTCEAINHDGRITSLLPPAHIRRVIHFPDTAFIELSGCASWATPLS